MVRFLSSDRLSASFKRTAMGFMIYKLRQRAASGNLVLDCLSMKKLKGLITTGNPKVGIDFFFDTESYL